MLYNWGDTRRFNSYAGYMKRTFGGRVQKLTVDAGFTCPNRDGRVGVGGCTFCNNNSFSPGYCIPEKGVIQQINEGITFHEVRYRRAEKYMVYFQAYSNTYAPLDYLKSLYEEALSHPKVVGIAIGTRPDCVDDDKLDYLAHLSEKYYVNLEFGVESCSNETLKYINRGHTFEQSVWAIEEAAKRNLNVGTHFIIGLPGETETDILEMVNEINRLPISSVKFHQLQVIAGTAMATEYSHNQKKFNFYTLDEYLQLMVRIVERLRPTIVFERFTGEARPETLIAPIWGKLRNDQVLVKFEKLLEEQNTWQGRLFME